MGRYCVMVDQALQRAAEHHARQVVVAKDHVLFTTACCQHTTFGAHLEQAIALNHGQVMIGEPAITERMSEHLDAGMRGNVGDERLRLASHRRVVDGEPVIGQGAPWLGLLIDKQDRGAALRRFERSAEARRPSTNHRHIAKQILLVLVAWRGRQIGHAKPRRFANHSLPPVPHTERLIKSAVVEPHGQEATKPIDDGIAIRHQTARDVLRHGLGIIGDGQFIREAIGRRRRLHQGVGVMPRHR